VTPAQIKRARDKYYGNEWAMPPECDPLCLARSCYQKYEKKGSFSVGRGYNSYNADMFDPVCCSRMCRGCPTVAGKRPEPEEDTVRTLLERKGMPRKISSALREWLQAATKDQEVGK